MQRKRGKQNLSRAAMEKEGAERWGIFGEYRPKENGRGTKFIYRKSSNGHIQNLNRNKLNRTNDDSMSAQCSATLQYFRSAIVRMVWTAGFSSLAMVW